MPKEKESIRQLRKLVRQLNRIDITDWTSDQTKYMIRGISNLESIYQKKKMPL